VKAKTSHEGPDRLYSLVSKRPDDNLPQATPVEESSEVQEGAPRRVNQRQKEKPGRGSGFSLTSYECIAGKNHKIAQKKKAAES